MLLDFFRHNFAYKVGRRAEIVLMIDFFFCTRIVALRRVTIKLLETVINAQILRGPWVDENLLLYGDDSRAISLDLPKTVWTTIEMNLRFGKVVQSWVSWERSDSARRGMRPLGHIKPILGWLLEAAPYTVILYDCSAILQTFFAADACWT